MRVCALCCSPQYLRLFIACWHRGHSHTTLRPKKTCLSARLSSPDPHFLDFIGKMLAVNPDERLSASQVPVARAFKFVFPSLLSSSDYVADAALQLLQHPFLTQTLSEEMGNLYRVAPPAE